MGCLGGPGQGPGYNVPLCRCRARMSHRLLTDYRVFRRLLVRIPIVGIALGNADPDTRNTVRL